MTYDELKARVRRIIGLHPESSDGLTDCIGHLSQFNGSTRGWTAETIARDLAEYVEAQPTEVATPNPAAVEKARRILTAIGDSGRDIAHDAYADEVAEELVRIAGGLMEQQ